MVRPTAGLFKLTVAHPATKTVPQVRFRLPTTVKNEIHSYRRALRLAHRLAKRWQEPYIFYYVRLAAARYIRSRVTVKVADVLSTDPLTKKDKRARPTLSQAEVRRFQRLNSMVSTVTRAELGHVEPMFKLLKCAYARVGLLRTAAVGYLLPKSGVATHEWEPPAALLMLARSHMTSPDLAPGKVYKNPLRLLSSEQIPSDASPRRETKEQLEVRQSVIRILNYELPYGKILGMKGKIRRILTREDASAVLQEVTAFGLLPEDKEQQVRQLLPKMSDKEDVSNFDQTRKQLKAKRELKELSQTMLPPLPYEIVRKIEDNARRLTPPALQERHESRARFQMPGSKTGDARKRSEPAIKTDDAGEDSEPAIKADDAEEDSEPAIKADDAEEHSEPGIKTDDAEEDSEPAIKTDDAEEDSEPAIRTDDAEDDSEPAIKTDDARSRSAEPFILHRITYHKSKDKLLKAIRHVVAKYKTGETLYVSLAPDPTAQYPRARRPVRPDITYLNYADARAPEFVRDRRPFQEKGPLHPSSKFYSRARRRLWLSLLRITPIIGAQTPPKTLDEFLELGPSDPSESKVEAVAQESTVAANGEESEAASTSAELAPISASTSPSSSSSQLDSSPSHKLPPHLEPQPLQTEWKPLWGTRAHFSIDPLRPILRKFDRQQQLKNIEEEERKFLARKEKFSEESWWQEERVDRARQRWRLADSQLDKTNKNFFGFGSRSIIPSQAVLFSEPDSELDLGEEEEEPSSSSSISENASETTNDEEKEASERSLSDEEEGEGEGEKGEGGGERQTLGLSLSPLVTSNDPASKVSFKLKRARFASEKFVSAEEADWARRCLETGDEIY